MAKDVRYKQCFMRRKTQTGHEDQVAWIPEEFAEKGRVLKIRDRGTEWEDGWKVITTADVSIDSEQAMLMSSEHKKHRDVTDI